MLKFKGFKYVKDNGDESHRNAFIMAEPYPHYRMLDVSELDPEQIEIMREILLEIEIFRIEKLEQLSEILGQNVNYMWRSFKKEGIEWDDEDK